MFALIIRSKQVKTFEGNIITEAGKKILVCNEPGGWVPATSYAYNGKIEGNAKIFATAEAATEFAKAWRGHPWYVVPGKRFEVVEVKQKFKQVADGYEPI